jgi:3-oxoisoapionate decarboxylase
MKSISMHIHSFSLRFRLRRPDFNVFDFIDLAASEGFTGVNISANGPGFRDLGGTSPDHFAKVRAHLASRGMVDEIDTSDTRPAHLEEMIGVAVACGADTLRVYTKYTGTLGELLEWTVRDLAAIAPIAARHQILIVLENHEDFQGAEIAEILSRVGSPWVAGLYDYGNSQMVGEDPFEALAAMAPHTRRVHLKDHVIVVDSGRWWVQGVAIGDGLLPIIEQTSRLYDAGVRRFCFENVWGYAAPVLSDPGQLPATPWFSTSHRYNLLDARNLALDDAVEGEWTAFRSGWDWLRTELANAGFTIEAE